MKSLSSVSLGLSVVFGCLLLALVGEVYYLVWRSRRRITNKMSENNSLFLYMFCLKKPSTQELCSSVGVISDTFVHENDQLQQSNNEDGQLEDEDRTSKDLMLEITYGEEEQIEAELMRVHGLLGPPRFLFTIVEETKEDLESEDGRSRRSVSQNNNKRRSLSDLLLSVDTPYLTPIASPSLFTPPLTPLMERFRATNEVSKDAEFNRMRSSPPPMFKFLQDAEEKLVRKMKMLEEEAGDCSSKTTKDGDGEEGNYITINVVDKERDLMRHNCYYSSSSSQVMPLDSLPFKQSNQEHRELVPSYSMKSSFL